MKIIAIVQARMGSSRLPGKVLQKIGDFSLIVTLLKRLSCASLIDKIVLATTDSKLDNTLAEHVQNYGFDVARGSENDVLSRYFIAAQKYKPEIILRITGDCPLIDPTIVDDLIKLFVKKKVDYASNSNPATFPDGLDVEIFSYRALEITHHLAKNQFDREHVTPFMRTSRFSNYCMKSKINYSDLRWTVDEEEDLKVIKHIFDYFYPEILFKWTDVLEYQKKYKYLFTNQYIKRNEGAFMSKGQKLWKRAKKIIPGGNMLLSKRPEMFLPDKWPSYFSKAKGVNIWDLDGIKYTDMCIMGIGTNILGYSNKFVDNAVRKVINTGNMSTFNCPEEVLLAEKLIELHPWADMVRFARSGGEANSIAIRIARAACGKDNVAICGYHGWHDWYLSANIADKDGLKNHLLDGLSPNGVPKNLKNTVFPFSYNNITELENLIKTRDIGIIKMEVSRSREPDKDYLRKVRKIASDNKIILIFDECTSGFRQSYGGLHKIYNVEPDMAMFGKALGNGYAITSVIGKRDIMEAAQSTFISSTFWTERIGPVAALETLKQMEITRSWEIITNIGNQIKKRMQSLSEKSKVEILQWGLPALTGYTILSKNSLEYKTYITQEFLKKKFLVGNSIYVSTMHSEKLLNNYFEILEKLFFDIRDFEDQKKSINDYLEQPVCHSGFQRLN